PAATASSIASPPISGPSHTLTHTALAGWAPLSRSAAQCGRGAFRPYGLRLEPLSCMSGEGAEQSKAGEGLSRNRSTRRGVMFKRIDHVELVTDQLEQTVEFYTEVLGFAVRARDRIERSGLGTPIDLVYLELG